MEERKEVDAEKIWEVAWTYIKHVVDTVREPFLILDEHLRVLSANRVFYSFFQVAPGQTEGNLVYKLGNGQWDIPKLKILLEDILPKNTFFDDFRVEHDFPKVGRKIMLLNARRIYTLEEKRPIMLLAMEDITKQVALEDQLKEYTKKLAAEVSKRTAKLEKRVQELERANKAMAKREQEMTALRKEIAVLRKAVKGSKTKGKKAVR